MNWGALILFAAGAGALGLGAGAIIRDPRALTHRVFCLGMGLFCLESLFSGLSLMANSSEQVLLWQRIEVFPTTVASGVWFFFSLSFSRSNAGIFLKKWRPAVVVGLLIPLVFPIFFQESLFTGALPWGSSEGWIIRLGWAGKVSHMILLLMGILVLVQLEITLRFSSGLKRWRIKFLILGLGAVFAAKVYTLSQGLLYSSTSTSGDVFNGCAVLVGEVLILIGFLRSSLFGMDLYVSHTLVFNSVVVLITGLYLFLVGVLAIFADHLGGRGILPAGALVTFFAMVALLVLMLSDGLRSKMKGFARRNLLMPRHDYRAIWRAFSSKVSVLPDKKAYLDDMVKLVSTTLESRGVTLWLAEDGGDGLSVGASTCISGREANKRQSQRDALRDLLKTARDLQGAVVCEDGAPAAFVALHRDFLERARIDCLVPLRWESEVLGLITLDRKLGPESYDAEDLELLEMMAVHIAAGLKSIDLSNRIQRTRQMEAFQAMSAFFVHDLKNLVSTLSLLLQNLPEHYQDPEFRQDALRMISAHVDKIRRIIRRLSSFREGIQIQRMEMELNRIVEQSISELNGTLRCAVELELGRIPALFLDPAQIRRVLTNLLLNADEATSNGERIRVRTSLEGPWAVISVSDQGCGMSPAFIQEFLFQPFRTTKKKGLGIGLYQSKALVEAHGGRIEVESEEGRGSTFRVLLPISDQGTEQGVQSR